MAVFTFENDRADSVDVTPYAGQDWSGFTISAGGSTTVESENSNIGFTFQIGDSSYDSEYIDYDSSTRTYTFTTYP